MISKGTQKPGAEQAASIGEVIKAEPYHQIFDTNTAVMLVIEPTSGLIVEANQAACQFYGYDASTITQMYIHQINTLSEEEVRQEMENAKTFRKKRFEFHHRLASGEIRNVEVYSGPIETQAGTLLYSIIHDITELKQIQNALRESEDKYRLVVENIQEAVCIVQNTRIVFANRVFALWVNMPLEEIVGKLYSEVMHRTQPVSQQIARHHQDVTTGKTHSNSWEIETNFSDGSLHWLIINSARILWKGEPAMLIKARDITGRKQIENALRESEELYRQLFEAESDAVVLIENDTGRILEANSAAVALYGYTREELLAMKNTDVSAEPEETRRVTTTTPIAVEKVVPVLLRWHRKKDGTVFPVEITGRFFHWKGRDVHIAAIRDITPRREAEEKILEQQKQLEAANARLEALVLKDPLTELFNRRAFNDRLTAEIAHATRYRSPLSLIIIDIDHFKIYNDTYGHPAGDEILAQLGQLLVRHTRETDFAARYGGEEFVLILSSTGVQGAIKFAERCRIAIERAEWPRRNITASFGITTLEPDSSPRIELQLVTEADQALYHSKKSGRNRVTHAQNLQF